MVFAITTTVRITNNNSENVNITIWKQILHVFLASIPYFTHGVETTELSASVHSGHFVPSSEVIPWTTTALILAAAASAPVYCWLVERWGRRSGMYLISLAQGASCIPLFLPSTEISVIFLHILAGVSSAGLFTVLPAYIREMSHDTTRGLAISFSLLLVILGYSTHMALNNEALMFLMVGLVAVQFLSLLMLIESPAHLLKLGKEKKAEKNLSSLYSVPGGSPVLAKELDLLKHEIERARANGKLSLWKILRNPLYRDITKIGIVMNTTIVLSGSIIFLEEDKALEQLKMAVDPTKTLTLTALAVGGLLTVAIVKFVERKYILTLAFCVETLSLGILGVHAHVDLTVATLRWLPVVSLVTLVSAYAAHWILSLTLVVEMLNLEIRSKLLAFLFVYDQLLKLLHIHTFQYVVELMGLPTVFYVFACINMFGAVYTIFIVPSIRNKTIRQIEKQMKRIPLLEFKLKPITA